MGLLERAAKFKYNRYMGVRVSQEVFDAIEQRASSRGLSISDILRELIHKEFVKESESERS